MLNSQEDAQSNFTPSGFPYSAFITHLVYLKDGVVPIYINEITVSHLCPPCRVVTMLIVHSLVNGYPMRRGKDQGAVDLKGGHFV